MEYREFIRRKSQVVNENGFDPIYIPNYLFDFQKAMVEWSLRAGRSALFEECGLGKTVQQLVWADNVVKHTNKPVMLATPIAVGQQTLKEAERFGIEAKRTRDGHMTDEACVWITNYEQLHKYDPSRFGGFVGDESSCIKDFKTERKATVVEFSREMPYRLLCTATAAPNDFWELGTSSEALGHLGFRDMITSFFKQETQKDFQGWGRTKYRFRGHAEQPFWKWVCSWARSMRRPSDLGFSDDGFDLPPLEESTVIVTANKPRSGMLFTLPAKDMQEERAERRHTIQERCEHAVAEALSHNGPTVLWGELNDETDLLEDMLPESEQVTGSMVDDKKEEILMAFSRGEVKRLITKAKITGWGLNWQHCSRVVVFPSHSFEQYYQLIRRCYRFGQKNPVKVTRILSEGEEHILSSLQRKHEQAERMFASIVAHMNDAMRLESGDYFPNEEVLPSWL